MIEENPKCPECGAQLQKLPPEEQGFPPIPMSTRIVNAFSFPIKGDGKLMVAFGTLMLWIGHYDWRLGGLAAGYMAAYLMKICKTAAIGRETPPEWPDSEDYFGLKFFFFAKLFSLLPAILYLVLVAQVGVLEFMAGGGGDEYSSSHEQTQYDVALGPDGLTDPDAERVSRPPRRESGPRNMTILGPLAPVFILGFLGAFYLPMAILAAALFRTWEVLNPIFVFQSIAKVKSDYIPIYIVLFIADAANMVGTALCGFLPWWLGDILGPLIIKFMWLYLMMIQMHVLGEMYCLNRKKLGWFTRESQNEPVAEAA